MVYTGSIKFLHTLLDQLNTNKFTMAHTTPLKAETRVPVVGGWWWCKVIFVSNHQPNWVAYCCCFAVWLWL